MQEFAEQILKNLENNGFPLKKVTLPTEKMYEIADNKGLSLNKVLEYLKNEKHVASEITSDKILFSPAFAEGGEMPPFDASMMSKVKEMMESMDPEQLKAIQEKVANMSDGERAEMMEKAKGMGLI